MANNHSLDQGLKGLDYTLNLLKAQNIQTTGANDNLDLAWQPAIVNANGIKVGFIGASYASINDGGKTRNSYVARIEDLDRLKAAISALKATANFIVVTMHAGTEYTRKPNAAQIAFAHAAIDDGADIVIGGHPHWIQTVEKYNGSPPYPNCKKSSFDNPVATTNGQKYQSLDLGNGCGGKYIFYSLGNFIFDQNFSPDTEQGLTLKLSLNLSQQSNATAPKAASLDDLQGNRLKATLIKIDLLPVILDNSFPRPATAQESASIFKKIGVADATLLP